MAEKIRALTDHDFLKISALFDFGKSVEELKWLFRDPNNPDSYNALVALNDKGRLIGVIGYIVSHYYDDKKHINGVIPMSWKIIPGYKGFAGILLMKNALYKGDFAFTIGGTKAALALYPIFKLDYVFSGYKFYKIFNPWKFMFSLKENFFRKIAKTLILLPAYIIKIDKVAIYNDVRFIEYNNSNLASDNNTGIFQKKISSSYISWLMQCPILESYAFHAMRGQIKLGICIFFIKKVKGFNRDRIVYLPFLGKDMTLWKTILFKSFEFFRSKGCCSISAFATNNIAISGYSTGMSKFVKTQKIFIKDTKHELQDIDILNWNIQFAEGDTVYLNV